MRRNSLSGLVLSFLPTVFACLAWGSTAHAHMVWLESVTSPGRLAVHAGFGEPNHWDRRNARKIEQTVYSIRRADGQNLPLTLKYHERAECFVADVEHTGPAAIVATCDYGVSSHGKSPSLVLFTAKRYVAEPEDWSRLDGAPALANLEISARQEGESFLVTVTSGGKPLAGIDVRFSGPKSDMAKSVTDATGTVSVPSEGSGAYALVAMRTLNEAGERTGEKYDAKREITTLTFGLGSAAPAPTYTASPEAAAMLGHVLQSQSLWGQDFAGFKSQVDVEYQGLTGKGTVAVSANGKVEVNLGDAHAELVREVTDWVESMAWHRAQKNVGQAQSQAGGPPRMLTAVAFADSPETTNARGTEIVPIHDPFASRFWTRDGKLSAAARQIGERKQTINVLSAMQTSDGRAIPTAAVSNFWDLNGRLVEVESESRQWVDVNGTLLPGEIRVVTTECAGFEPAARKLVGGSKSWRVFSMRFSGHELLSGK